MTRRYFRRGQSTFTCAVCKRLTREVNQSGTGLCPQCYEICGLDNTVNDNGYLPGTKDYNDARAECDRLLAEIVAKGGDGERVKHLNEYIWSDPS